MTKIINKLAMVCVMIALSFCCFVGCTNNEHDDTPNADYYAKLGYHKVTYSSDITFDTNNDSIVVISSNTFMTKPNTTIIPLSIKSNNKQVAITSDVQRETINFDNSTYLSGLKINHETITFSTAATGIIVNQNLNISLSYSHFKISGFAIYNISDSNENINLLNSNQNYIQTLLTKSNDNLTSSDKFLMFTYQSGGLNHNNPTSLKSKSTYKINSFTSTNLDISIEIFEETEETDNEDNSEDKKDE